ncbi:AcrR family transcriptional regulator [Conyzicola lurida]|uniref:AcrR family transcriptional regulator n=1 Tax=Conyzicola lurida TaxID=1172621 RepID=A0A841AJC0_9MICO|nr:TetR/AcrR family transcriptional regulator [Conyzicola lurida]MBB5844000.1 AcrR family transcriptional regulator [Conyzicola lurida]
MTTVPAEGRNARRKERTRAALVRAAQELLATGHAHDASIKAITELADVGFGSFFNHFENKAELFDAALTEVAQRYEEWLDERLSGVTDPLRRLSLSIRYTGRLHLSHPEQAHLLIGQYTALYAGKAPLDGRIRADVAGAMASLSPTIPRGPSTEISAMGSIGAVLAAASTLPEEDRAQLADSLVADVLRLIGADDAVIAELLGESLG